MRVCIGGTFDILHQGHQQLITKACEIAGKNGVVFIGVATGKLAEKQRTMHSFEQRIQALEAYILLKEKPPKIIIAPIQEKYGPSIKEEYDTIVVSPETKVTAEEINEKRKQLGKKPLQIVVIPFVQAEDNKPISSTRIRRKEIDENGRVLPQE